MAKFKLLTRIPSLAVLVACGVSAGCGMVANTHNMTGVNHYQRGNYQAAVQQFQKAIDTHHENADGYYNLASSVHKLGTQQKNREMLNQAESLYNQCLNLDENHVECHRALAVLLVETNRPDSAFTLMKNWVANVPQSDNARVELARLYEEFGDNESATLNLQQAVQLNANNHRALAALGRLREQAGDVNQALVNYQRSYQVNPAQPGVAARIASLRGVPTGAPATSVNGTRTVRGPTTPRY